MSDWKNQLYFGDNLEVMRDYISSECVDLVYLDPPFNSNATYNVLFADKTGAKSSAQIEAFDDTWHWGPDAEDTYRETITHGPKKLSDLLQALRSFLGTNDMMAYLTMMAPRLVELHRALKPTGSLYLHCDPTASHYLKLVMDAIFGHINFRNEIIWKRTSAHSSAKRCGPVHDVLLFYSKCEAFLWNPQHTAHSDEYIKAFYRNQDEDGRKFTLSDLTAAGVRHGSSGQPWRGFDPGARGNHWKFTIENLEALDAVGRLHWPKAGGWPRYRRFLDEVKGVPLQDIWTDIPPIGAQAAERLGYPTQKPLALLERIIWASSNEGDLVLDPFCGCGTTVAAAEHLRRRWIGIDITPLAIRLIEHRLATAYGSDLQPYEVHGVPKDLDGAEALAKKDRHLFEQWAVLYVGAQPGHGGKKGADSGYDGYIPFFDDESGRAKKALVSVKSGEHVTVVHVREFRTVMEQQKADIGVIITLNPPTKPMEQAALEAGYYEPANFTERFPRLQLLPVDKMLKSEQVKYPRYAPAASYKAAERKKKDPGQKRLF